MQGSELGERRTIDCAAELGNRDRETVSSKLVGYVRRIPFGERLPTRKLALFAFADSANERGEGLESDIDAIMEAAEVGERSAKAIRSELRRAGILVREHAGGGGAGDRARYRLNVEVLERLAAGELNYCELIARDKGATNAPLKGEADCTLENGEGEAGCTLKGETKGATKGETKGATVPTPLEKKKEGEGSYLVETSNLEPISPLPPIVPPRPSNAPVPAGRQWGNAVEELRAQGKALAVVEHLIAPLAATKAPGPRLSDPRQELRDIRDAIAELELEESALQLARKRLAAEWVRDFPHLKACLEACEQARIDAMYVAQPGTPEHAAWIAHFLADPAKAMWARAVARNKWPLTVPAQWPPASPEVEDPGEGALLWSIGPHTPEWHAHLTHWRRNGRAPHAQAAEINGTALQTESRWPVETAS